MKDNKPVLSGLSLQALQNLLPDLPAYRAHQVFQWMSRGAPSFQTMSDIPISLRESLDRRCALYSSSIADQLEDSDGTVKLQLILHDKERIESVLLSDGAGRKTACLSTQAGCPMACVFCKTGRRGFSRNLNTGEIVEQFLHLRSIAGDIDSIVVMGMGEPLLNLPELRKAVEILTDPEGIGLSKRRITLSTCGIVQGIRELADLGPQVRLAVSLTAGDPVLREQLMPVTKTNPLPALKDALQYYQRKYGQRITLEAVLLGGTNTREIDLQAFAAFAEGLDAIVNVIPWNPVEGARCGKTPLREPFREEIERFIRGLERRGLKVTRRLRKGQGIAGACGQLA
ncbi:MAG: 23S rRNA (adenine(2503)-C(2))-methyltransferase RlmN [Spirochaetaceae bacterium]|jgi:23S rRNA (adenine2503-C2)-methyltransferase|nr:23S rRNA (adenine(2503)-C(2))-methyltransferase RlmN [Spirochaetaceae bacterium]